MSHDHARHVESWVLQRDLSIWCMLHNPVSHVYMWSGQYVMLAGHHAPAQCAPSRVHWNDMVHCLIIGSCHIKAFSVTDMMHPLDAHGVDTATALRAVAVRWSSGIAVADGAFTSKFRHVHLPTGMACWPVPAKLAFAEVATRAPATCSAVNS
jgi:hypothetical protein